MYTRRKIYLASSWKNPHQPEVLRRLREDGHEVYDFRNPAPGNDGFSWKKVKPNPEAWSLEEYLDVLDHPVAREGLQLDYDAMRWSDTVVAVAPFGRSTALELGWGIGSGRDTAVFYPPGSYQEPELMVRLADQLLTSEQELRRWLRFGIRKGWEPLSFRLGTRESYVEIRRINSEWSSGSGVDFSSPEDAMDAAEQNQFRYLRDREWIVSSMQYKTERVVLRYGRDFLSLSEMRLRAIAEEAALRSRGVTP